MASLNKRIDHIELQLRNAHRSVVAEADQELRLSPKQIAFLASSHPRRLIRAGNQVGKSEGGALEAIAHLRGYSPFKTIPNPGRPTLGIILVADKDAIKRPIGERLWNLIPRHELKKGSTWNEETGWGGEEIRMKNGNVAMFKSSEQAVTAFSGDTVDWIWQDEPTRQAIWGELRSRGFVLSAPLWVTMTPIGRPVEWFRKVVEGDPEKGVPPLEEWEQYVIRLSTEDAPFRTPESITAQISGYLAEELPQRVNGEWEGVAVDRRFTGFTDLSVHALPRRSWYLGTGMDHGEDAGREYALTIAWDDKNVWAVDEYVNDRATSDEEDAAGIRLMWVRQNLVSTDIDRIVGDVNSAGKGKAGRRINDLMAEHLRHEIETPNKEAGSVIYGCRLINTALHLGILKISPACKVLIRSLRYWKGADDDLKHAVDALRYIAREPLERILLRHDAFSYMQVR